MKGVPFHHQRERQNFLPSCVAAIYLMEESEILVTLSDGRPAPLVPPQPPGCDAPAPSPSASVALCVHLHGRRRRRGGRDRPLPWSLRLRELPSLNLPNPPSNIATTLTISAAIDVAWSMDLQVGRHRMAQILLGHHGVNDWYQLDYYEGSPAQDPWGQTWARSGSSEVAPGAAGRAARDLLFGRWMNLLFGRTVRV